MCWVWRREKSTAGQIAEKSCIWSTAWAADCPVLCLDLVCTTTLRELEVSFSRNLPDKFFLHENGVSAILNEADIQLSKSNLSVCKYSDIVYILQWSDFFFLSSKLFFCYIFLSEWWMYGIFLETEKWEFFMLLNACVILVGEEVPGKWGVGKDSIKTNVSSSDQACIRFQVRLFNQWPHGHVWSPGILWEDGKLHLALET